ncbi:MAG: glycoside hydrolase family 5 protein [Prevotella sp.]|nr:glycoside hydrolase family 5 protein [Prevotella sp.]
MKQLLLFTSILMGLFCNEARADGFETATQAVQNMGVGWNLGNTLDANNQSVTNISSASYWGQQGLDSETCWGQPTTTAALITMMKNAGFGAIRVPVTWYNHMDSNGNVNAAWMARVKEVVDYVIDAGLYCIINVHHDTGADSNTSKHWIHASTTSYNNNKTRYENLWRQIANEFKSYGDKLLFEGYNEMLDEYNSWCWPSRSYNNAENGYTESIATASYNAINNYAQSFVNAVRGTGGNNVNRNLIVNTYAASSGGRWNTHCNDPLTKLNKPSGENNHIIFEVHTYPNISNLNSAKTDVANMFTDINSYLKTKAPVIIGEWGTSNVDNGSDYANNRTNMINFLDYFVKKAKDNNIATFYWMGLTDGVNRSLPAFNQADLAQTIVNAYHGSISGYQFPTPDDFQTIYTVNYTQEWSEAFLYGDWNRTAQSLSNYKGILVEMEDDSYAGKLQIKVYGVKNGTNPDGSDKFKEQYAQFASGSSSTMVTFDASILGSTFWGVTLQTLSGAMTAKVKKVTLIKADNSEISLSVTSAWGCTVTSESTPINTSIQNLQPDMSKTDDAIYNLNGQRVNTPQKGIYIRNGKKFIMK